MIFQRDQTLLAYDPGRLKLNGDATPIAEHIALNDATVRFSASNTGVLSLQDRRREGRMGLALVYTGREADWLRGGTGALLLPGDFARSKPAAVSLFNGSQGTANIWILDLKRGTKSRLTVANGTQLGSE